MTDDHNGAAQPGTTLPLKSSWDNFRRRFELEKRLDPVEIELMRLMFFYGARAAVLAASRGSAAIRMMHSELSVFDREVAPYLADTFWDRNYVREKSN
jgi:hypothetical protein